MIPDTELLPREVLFQMRPDVGRQRRVFTRRDLFALAGKTHKPLAVDILYIPEMRIPRQEVFFLSRKCRIHVPSLADQSTVVLWGVVKLGEHNVRNVEVAGSVPAISIKSCPMGPE